MNQKKNPTMHITIEWGSIQNIDFSGSHSLSPWLKKRCLYSIDCIQTPLPERLGCNMIYYMMSTNALRAYCFSFASFIVMPNPGFPVSSKTCPLS